MAPAASPDRPGSAPEVYGATADTYVAFAGTVLSEQTEDAWELGLLDEFVAELPDGASVVDVGCGPGRAAAWLAARGLEVRGVEPSEVMVATARREHPTLRFEVGSLQAMPLDDGAVDALVAWYSIIHDPLDALEPAWVEMARVVRPGGRVLLAFQSGTGEIRRRENVFESGGDLDFHRHDPALVAAGLRRAGFMVDPPKTRLPAAEHAHESTPQTLLTATRPG